MNAKVGIAPIAELIAAHLDGDATALQREQLSQELRINETVRKQFHSALRQAILLGEILHEQSEPRTNCRTPLLKR